jgi:transcriptional regulator with XRE-family HTH domain
VKERSENEYLKEFGNRVKVIRKKVGYSQERLAYESNVELRQIGRIERGEINTGILSVKIISETLGVDQKDFFDF